MRACQHPGLARPPTQRPHQIPSHLPPAVRRPPATASPLEDPLLPSHGDTCRGSARMGVRTNSLYCSSLNLLPFLLALGCVHMYTRTHTPQLSPMLQELQQEVIASVGHDILRNPGGEKNVQWRGGRVWIPGFLLGRGGRGSCLALSGTWEGKGAQALTWW